MVSFWNSPNSVTSKRTAVAQVVRIIYATKLSIYPTNVDIHGTRPRDTYELQSYELLYTVRYNNNNILITPQVFGRIIRFLFRYIIYNRCVVRYTFSYHAG